MRLERKDMLRHAADWVAAWNRRDLDAVLAGYAEQVRFYSPLAQRITGSALVAGKQDLTAYWRTALDSHADLHFELVDVICDVEAQTMVVRYLAHLNGTVSRACEVFRFEDGVTTQAEAFRGADAP
jgi:ketosteroid isomerase-like protein